MATTKQSLAQQRRADLAARLGDISGEQEERLAQYRATAQHLPYISLTTYPLSAEALLVASKELAKKAKAVVFYRRGGDIRIGAVNPSLPSTAKLLAAVRKSEGVEPQVYVISERSLLSALARYPAPRQTREDTATTPKALAPPFIDLAQLTEKIGQVPPTRLLDYLIAAAVQLAASDVHLEVAESSVRLRLRIDGVLMEVAQLPKATGQMVLSRVKILAKLKLNVSEVAQEGSFPLAVEQGMVDVRVSILPGRSGENIVLRVLVRDRAAFEMTGLGMKERDYELVAKELGRTIGLVLVTGPTGSGKTTTLASFITEIVSSELKIITLEDPIEYHLTGVQQTQINRDAGYTYTQALKAALRQDPDIIMVGEIREIETAETALHAALTGHLVLSSFHTNDAAGAIIRLRDMGVKPYVLAPAINLVVAQRLVRKVCKSCAESYRPDKQLIEELRDAMAGVDRDIFEADSLTDKKFSLLKAKGCQQCLKTGYQGRTGLFEVFAVTDKLEELILKGASAEAIIDEARRSGMTTLLQDGYLKAIDQITTIEEVQRVTED